jgi:hypothetical protein
LGLTPWKVPRSRRNVAGSHSFQNRGVLPHGDLRVRKKVLPHVFYWLVYFVGANHAGDASMAAGGTRAAVLRALACFAALVALLFPAVSARAQGDGAGQGGSEPAWIPSLDVGFEGLEYDFETTVVNLGDPSVWSEIQNESVNQLLFRIGGELMGPMFEGLPGRPRLFVQGGAGLNAFAGEDIYELGKPDNLFEPQGGIDAYLENGPVGRVLPDEFEGQGSRLDGDFQKPTWYAGLGIAFSVPTSGELLFYIKPSVQYNLERMDFVGKLKTVYEPPPPGIDPPEGPFTRTFEIRESSADFDTTDHSIGPGLEVAMAFLSSRPIRFSLFGQVRFLWLISDDTNSFTDADGFASYTVERDDFIVRGGAGIRLSWVGFD